jgi:hypothetical protein
MKTVFDGGNLPSNLAQQKGQPDDEEHSGLMGKLIDTAGYPVGWAGDVILLI